MLIRFTLLAALAMLSVCGAQAQETQPSRSDLLVWGYAGAGVTRVGPMVGGSVSLSQWETTLFTARLTHAKELRICIFGPCDAPTEYQTEAAILYGVMAKERWGYVAASAGVGVATGQQSEVGAEVYVTPSLPLDLRLALTPLPFLGIGIDFIASVTGERVNVGGMLGVEVGVLW